MSTAETPILTNEDATPDIALTVSQWADERRVLTRFTSAEPGTWRTDRTPYLREIMDAFGDPTVEEITFRKSTQIGGTEVILNAIGYAVDYDPAPMIVVLPRDEDAKGWAFKRVKPMIESSPALSKHVTGKEDDLSGKFYKFDRMFIKFAGANSPADLASDPCRFVLMDEVDKYPKYSGRESDPVKLAIERTRTFWNKKIMKASTPTTKLGYIERDFQRSDKRRYWVPCPHCGHFQPLYFGEYSHVSQRPRNGDDGPAIPLGRIRWPEGATADEIKAYRLAWYECGVCKAKIEESAKAGMNERGVWVPEGCAVSLAGELVGAVSTTAHRGYAISALYSPFVSWSEIAQEFLDAKSDHSLLMAFVNSVLGEPWQERAHETKEDDLKKRIWEPLTLGTVASGAVVLTAGVDVQKDYFCFVIRAFGIGEESWLVRYGRLESWDEVLYAITKTQYQKVGGGVLEVRLACVDSGYRTSEVYEVCRARPDRLRAIKGYESQATPIRVSMLDKDNAGRPIQGGLALWNLDVTYFKDKLNRQIHTKSGEPGEWHLANGVAKDYFDQLTSERKVVVRNKTTGRISESWQPVRDGAANHFLDCETYALAAAEMLKVYLLRPPTAGDEIYSPPPRDESSSSWRRDRSSWNSRGGWFRR